MASAPTVKAAAALDAEALQAFAMGVRGHVLQPADPGYDEARLIWNGLIDRRPALIVRRPAPPTSSTRSTSPANTA